MYKYISIIQYYNTFMFENINYQIFRNTYFIKRKKKDTLNAQKEY